MIRFVLKAVFQMRHVRKREAVIQGNENVFCVCNCFVYDNTNFDFVY
jgi:hypothetical protein